MPVRPADPGATPALQAAASVYLADAMQWLNEYAPGWKEDEAATVLSTALQALFLAEHERTGRGGMIARAMAHQVALLICQEPLGTGKRGAACNAFDALLDEAINQICQSRGEI